MKTTLKFLFLCFGLFTLMPCKKDSVIPQQMKHLKIRVFVKNLQNPWGMAFLPNEDFVFLERNGNINLLKKGANDYSLIMFRAVQTSEGGLLGLAIDPDYNSNHFIYIY